MTRVAFLAEKVMPCYKCKTRHIALQKTDLRLFWFFFNWAVWSCSGESSIWALCSFWWDESYWYSHGEKGGCGPFVVENSSVESSVEGISEASFMSESDLTSTFNSEFASYYVLAADIQSEELPTSSMPTAPSKVPMGQVVQKQIPFNLRKKGM